MREIFAVIRDDPWQRALFILLGVLLLIIFLILRLRNIWRLEEDDWGYEDAGLSDSSRSRALVGA